MSHGPLLKALRAPLVLAPMAGVSDAALVAAGARSGILAFHGAAFRKPEQLRQDIAAVRASSGEQAVFGVNLFVFDDKDADYERAGPGAPRQLSAGAARRAERALETLRPMYDRFGASAPDLAALNEQAYVRTSQRERFEAQLQVVLETKVPVFSFCFGCLDGAAVRTLQANGTTVFGTATSVAEAVALVEAGVDGVMAQGAEAGGHRGSFLPDTSLVGTMSLVPQVVDAVGSAVPVVAAGGIVDARGVRAALALGAQAAAMGTAFVASKESAASEAHKRAIVAARETETAVTRVFSGRPARGVYNEMAQEYDGNVSHGVVGIETDNIAAYPVQQLLTNPLKALGHATHMSLWAGQGCGLISTADRTVEEIVQSVESGLASDC